MSMHLESHAYTTTSTKKAKEKKPTKAMLNQWKSDYDSCMRERKRTGERTITFSQWLDERKGIVTHLKPLPVTKSTAFNFNASKAVIRETVRHPSRNPADVSPAIAPPPKVYTGDAMIGIAQMAKSNAVPVFRQSDAVDISKMRRG